MGDTSSTSPRLVWIANAKLEAARLLRVSTCEAMQAVLRQTQHALDEAERHVCDGAIDLADAEIGIVGEKLNSLARTLVRDGPNASP